MNKTDAYIQANQLLHKIIENQPEFLQCLDSDQIKQQGKLAAQICIDFVETYSDWLNAQGKTSKK